MIKCAYCGETLFDDEIDDDNITCPKCGMPFGYTGDNEEQDDDVDDFFEDDDLDDADDIDPEDEDYSYLFSDLDEDDFDDDEFDDDEFDDDEEEEEDY